jgi:hypothetical protein
MRFISNLRPLLNTATTTTPYFSRTLSILGAGHEGKVDFDDLELRNTYSTGRCATHTITMNDFMAEEFAARDQGTTFIHSSPGIVNTGAARELPVWARAGLTLLKPVLYPFMVSPAETGARQLFLATSGVYPPAKPAENAALASGVPGPKGFEIMKGANGQVGSGSYLVNWNGDITGKKILDEYHEKGVGKIVWEHTMGIFGRVEKINKGRSEAGPK